MVDAVGDDGGVDSDVAPVTPLFGASAPVERADGEAKRPAWHTTWNDESDLHADDDHDACSASEWEIAERTLLKKLRTRSLSVREARAVVAKHSLDADQVEDVLAAFLDRKYLDDVALAGQLVHSSIERKGHGRQAIAQALARRGIPREVADEALAALPDDDADRALDFARSKARSMGDIPVDTALRRLVGQLARRGYPGPVAMTAAKAALADPSARSGVRFR